MDHDSCIDTCTEYPCHLKTNIDNIDLWGDLCSVNHLVNFEDISKKYAPHGYQIKLDGIKKRVDIIENDNIVITWVTVSKTPIWIETVHFGTDNKVYITIVFTDINGKIKRLTVDQKEILTRNGILELTSHGINSTDYTAKYLTEYFSISLADKKYEVGKIYTKMGWHDKLNTFVLGNRVIRKNNETKSIFVKTVQEEIISAYSQKGTPQQWYNYVSELMDYDNVRFSIYTACTPPLLRVLNSKSFVKEDTGDTSIGKTTNALIGMSIWGNPFDLTLSTDTTAYAIEENCTIRNDLPILLDDITLMEKDTLNRIVYMVANEGGKNRGQKEGGLREVNRWKSVVMTTGELYITGSKSTGGAEVRIVSTDGGIGFFNPELIKKYESNILKNYGVIGPLIIQKILENKDLLIEEYNKNINDFEEKASEIKDPDGVMKRLIKTYAAIAVAGEVFEDVLNDLGFGSKNPFLIVADKLGDKIKNTTGKLSERAFEAVQDWHQSESRCFCQDGAGDAGDKYQLFGNTHSETTDEGHYEYLDVIPSELEKILDKYFERNGVLKSFIKSWIGEGIIIPYLDKKTGKIYSTRAVTLKHGLKQQRAYRFVMSRYTSTEEGA